MEKITLNPILRVEGEINLPGSKSLSNRALLLAALAHGTTEVTNLLDSDDIRHMLNALKSLGVSYELSSDKTVCTITGVGGGFNWQNGLSLFLGNAGTAMRPLAAALCLKGQQEAEVVLTGEPRMKERPIKHLVDALIQVGANVQYLEQDGYPPLAIRNTGLQGGKVQIDGSISSQFLTALLMAAPLAEGDMEIQIMGELVSKPYIDITLAMMKDFGVTVENQNYQTFIVKGNQSYISPKRYLVEGDASSASYFLAAGAIKGKVKVTGIGKNSIQGDRLFAEGETVIRNIYNWRVKETDRLSAMATELRKIGAEVEEGEDFIRIQPLALAQFQVAEIATYNDHRMAMCFSLIALSNTPVTILDPKCTAKTFPTYFSEFEKLSIRA